jgi:hypothetical protein
VAHTLPVGTFSFQEEIMKKILTTGFNILMFNVLFVAFAAHGATSTFDAGTEEWTAVGDIAGSVQWFAEGGNPGGHVRAIDATLGGVTYFQAPTSYLGDQSGAINTNLSFDLQQTISGSPNQFDSNDVVLVGDGLTLVFDLATNPSIGSWSHYVVPLTASSWHVSTPAGPMTSDAQFSQVLSDLTALRIRAEYQTGADTGYLDNVSMVPEPESWAMLLFGLGIIVMTSKLRTRQVVVLRETGL